MATPPTAHPPVDPAFLSGIVQKAKAGGVVPIIGPDLLLVDGPNGREPLYTRIARELAREYGLPALADETTLSLDRLFGEAKRAGRPVREFHSHVAEAVLRIDRHEPAIEALRLLASIDWFRLFLSLTPDGLLSRALDVARFGGRPRTVERAYSLSDWQDVTRKELRAQTPIVYHLLGRAVPLPGHFAVTEADAVEFFHKLQQSARQPPILLERLQHAHLLVLGADLPDWLLRFLLRIGRGHPLRHAREYEEYMLLRSAPPESLVWFLGSHAPESHYVEADPLELLRALHAEWAGADGSALVAADPDEALRPGRYVFISYAREDLAEALRLQTWLEKARIPVWLDQDGGLPGGVAWDAHIRRRIAQCGVFIPLLSRNTVMRLSASRLGGEATSAQPYFPREWAAALETAQARGEPGEGFVIPLAIHPELLQRGAPLPAQFAALQVEAAPDGRPADALVRRLSRALGVGRDVG